VFLGDYKGENYDLAQGFEGLKLPKSKYLSANKPALLSR
jgi:hypothetical protein